MAKDTQECRQLLFSEGTSNKFWNIVLRGSSHTVTFGRVGTAGRTQTKEFDREDEAKTSFDKLSASKLKKGYVDSGGGASAATPGSKPVAKAGEEPRKAGAEAAAKAPLQAAAVATPAETPAKAQRAPSPPPTQQAPAAPSDVDLRVTREIDLKPEDWFRAGFRPRQRLERGQPAAFRKEDCLSRLAELKTTTYGWEVRWSDLKLPASLAPEEAHFWLLATTTPRDRETTMKQFADRLEQERVDGQVSIAAARGLIDKAERGICDETTLALANVLSPDDYLELLLAKPTSALSPWIASGQMKQLVDGFGKHVVPYLADGQIELFRQRIRTAWDPTQDSGGNYACFPAEYYVAAAIGMYDEVYEVTSRWADDRYQKDQYRDHYEAPQQLVFGLGSSEIVAAEWRRLKLKMRAANDVRAFLACTEFSALDCIADCIVAQTNKEECEGLLKAFVLVRAPEAAEPMLRCKLEAKTPAIARDWLDKHVGNAVAGLIAVAGGRGRLATAALEYLQGVKRKGLAAVIADQVESAGDAEAAARVRADVLEREEKVFEPCDDGSTPAWLAHELEALEGARPKRLASWATPAMLPPLLVGDRRLNDGQMALVLHVLASIPVTEQHALLTALRQNLPAQVRDEFVWKLFQHWQEDGFPSKDKWAMGAIGHLGGDGCVLKLTPLIRVWPGESQHARAVFGLECLRAIGSSTALMQLSGVAQKLKFKGLKTKAQQFVDEIATERGMTREELEDRVVPDCGLDENGRRVFSFGPRSFAFVLDGDLKAQVRDEHGKLRPNLPNPGAKDDAQLAAEATAEWKILKKQIKDVATIQAGRLEQAMVTGRRWGAEDFETLLVRHPLMTHLVQKLIWGGFDAQGTRFVTFRVTEERDFADPEDNTLELDKITAVGVIHALDLSDAERSRWGEVMSDYEIVAPFPQLGRAVYGLEPGEGQAEELQRFHELKLVAPTLVFTLEKLGWIRGTAMDGGCFDEHSKQFPAANVTAVVGYDGNVGMAYIDPNEMLTTKSIHFCQGLRDPSGYGWGSQSKLTLAQVPPIVISEVIADLQVLKSKAK